MEWNKFAAEVHQVAVDHGFWDPKPSFAAITVMCCTELAEAGEEYRAGRPMVWHKCNAGLLNGPCVPGDKMSCFPDDPTDEELPVVCPNLDAKPQGVAVEMGDCVLRILDTLAEAGVDIDADLGFTPASKDLIETVAGCYVQLATAYIWRGKLDRAKDGLLTCMETILDWARQNGVDMEAVLRAKHEYNKTRPFRHGGKKL